MSDSELKCSRAVAALYGLVVRLLSTPCLFGSPADPDD